MQVANKASLHLALLSQPKLTLLLHTRCQGWRLQRNAPDGVLAELLALQCCCVVRVVRGVAIGDHMAVNTISLCNRPWGDSLQQVPPDMLALLVARVSLGLCIRSCISSVHMSCVILFCEHHAPQDTHEPRC